MNAFAKNAGSGASSKRRIMRALKINEISAVDTPAQQGALATIMKRQDATDPNDGSTRKAKLAAKRAALTTSVDGHSHLIAIDHGRGELTSGETDHTADAEGRYHSHPWVRREDGNIVIGEAIGHTHDVSEIGKNTPAVAGSQKAGDAGTNVGEQEDNPMTDKSKSAEDSQETRVAELEKQLERANAIAALSADERAHFENLEGETKEEFLGKSAEERKGEIAKAADANAVVYKDAAGNEYRKSDDPRLVTLAKQADEDRKARVAAEKRAADSDLRKRADELDHIPGDVDTRVEMLRAIDAIPNEEARKRSLEALKAQNTAMGKAFEQTGHADASSPEARSAEDELESLAKKYAEDHEVTEQVAYSKILQTERGQELYEQTVQ